jgi:hypothetical protein
LHCCDPIQMERGQNIRRWYSLPRFQAGLSKGEQ